MKNGVEILLIEDDPSDTFLITELLGSIHDFEHEITHCSTLHTAIAALKEHRFNVILSDMGLPDSQGYSTFESVFAASVGTPLIVLTHLEDEKIAMMAIEHDAQDYLFKTDLTGTMLVKSIRFALARHSLKVALKESETRARSIINAIPDMLVIMNSEGVFIDYKAASEDIAYQSQSIIGKKNRDITPPEFADLLHQKIRFTLDAGQLHTFEYQLSLPSVGIREFEARMGPGNPDEVIAIVRDVTERKKAEAEIILKNEQLLQSNIEKDKFFSIVAHDLRSPFNAFLGFTKMFVDELDTFSIKDLQKIALSMRNSATNLFALLENLLEWSRLRRGVTDFKPETFLLKDFGEESIISVMEPANKKGIEIKYEIAENIAVYADRYMLASVLRNLVSNATKFTRKGDIITLTAKSDFEHSVEISISDTGIGMNINMIENLFHLDEQTNRKGTEGEPSTGL
ncbi:MAG: response regulator, partial [Bacteroidota bacterium]